jgi:hypothetical protein
VSRNNGSSWNPVEVVKREQGLQSNRLPADLKEKVEAAVESLEFRVTPGDVAAKAGVKLADAESALQVCGCVGLLGELCRCRSFTLWFAPCAVVGWSVCPAGRSGISYSVLASMSECSNHPVLPCRHWHMTAVQPLR